MRNFKQHLNEHVMLDTRKDVEGWIQEYCSDNQGNRLRRLYAINADLTIDIVDDVIVSYRDDHIPVKFNKISGDFTIRFYQGSSWDFLPKSCQNLKLDYNKLAKVPSEIKNVEITGLSSTLNPITTFDNVPKNISHLTFVGAEITSLIGIQDKLVLETLYDGFGTPLMFDWDKIREGGLGLLLVSGVEPMSRDGNTLCSMYQRKLPPAFEIINRHLKDKDVFSCQQELIEKGYEAYAQL